MNLHDGPGTQGGAPGRAARESRLGVRVELFRRASDGLSRVTVGYDHQPDCDAPSQRLDSDSWTVTVTRHDSNDDIPTSRLPRRHRPTVTIMIAGPGSEGCDPVAAAAGCRFRSTRMRALASAFGRENRSGVRRQVQIVTCYPEGRMAPAFDMKSPAVCLAAGEPSPA